MKIVVELLFPDVISHPGVCSTLCYLKGLSFSLFHPFLLSSLTLQLADNAIQNHPNAACSIEPVTIEWRLNFSTSRKFTLSTSRLQVGLIYGDELLLPFFLATGILDAPSKNLKTFRQTLDGFRHRELLRKKLLQ